jgi:hypothetical protein
MMLNGVALTAYFLLPTSFCLLLILEMSQQPAQDRNGVDQHQDLLEKLSIANRVYEKGIQKDISGVPRIQGIALS